MSTSYILKRPQHIAIIMDGNGRWATERNLKRQAGHERGVDTLRKIIRAAGDEQIKHLTIYSFSSENWQRPKAEVTFLMGLIKRYIQSDLETLHAHGVNIKIIGRRQGLEKQLLRLITEAETLTRANENLYLQIAFNYGAHEEIADTAKRLAQQVQAGTISPADISPETFAENLPTASAPAPDLLIRTGGEMRLSNFLLWQCAYTEFYFTDILWPDFTGDDLRIAIAAYGQRNRRYGKLSAPEDFTEEAVSSA